MIQITSDLHINDSNIFKYQYDRKLKYNNSVSIMNREIVSYQNYTVDNDDVVYVIGDFISGKNKKNVFNILNKLNGNIYLILGNHDVVLKNYNNISNKITIIKNIYNIRYKEYIFYMFHWPLLEQPNFYNKKSIHLYGHIHGKYAHTSERAIDVSFNVWDFRLIKIDDIIKRIEKN